MQSSPAAACWVQFTHRSNFPSSPWSAPAPTPAQAQLSSAQLFGVDTEHSAQRKLFTIRKIVTASVICGRILTNTQLQLQLPEQSRPRPSRRSPSSAHSMRIYTPIPMLIPIAIPIPAHAVPAHRPSYHRSLVVQCWLIWHHSSWLKPNVMQWLRPAPLITASCLSHSTCVCACVCVESAAKDATPDCDGNGDSRDTTTRSRSQIKCNRSPTSSLEVSCCRYLLLAAYYTYTYIYH